MTDEKIIEAYRFALRESLRLFKTDKEAFNHLKVLGSLAHIHLMRNEIDADKIMNEILGDDEDEE